LSNDRAERRFLGAARDAMLAKPEVVHIALVDKSARVVWSVASPGRSARPCARQTRN